jgi:hypothetical protein
MKKRGKVWIVFLFWWYSDATVALWVYQKRFFLYLADLYSVRICFATLFDVWRRDGINTDNMSIQEKMNVAMLNFASRFVGFTIKTFCLLAYLSSLIFVFIATILVWLFWFSFPILAVISIVYGFYLIWQNLASGGYLG